MLTITNATSPIVLTIAAAVTTAPSTQVGPRRKLTHIQRRDERAKWRNHAR